MDGIDPDRLAEALRVLAEAERLPTEHPDAIAVRHATGRLFKTVKEQRRAQRRSAGLASDRAVTAATATGAPGRIDDETRGLALTSGGTGTGSGSGSGDGNGNGSGSRTAARAGTLTRARACYVCKQRYRDVDAFYHQLCPRCAAVNHERRKARTDLTGRRALLTGGRAKIGMYIALRLLRDGAHTTITTRFPRDAARRFTAMSDSADWLHRLRVVGIDLRDPGQVVALADEVAAQGPLDILINNAAQTIRRSPAAYAELAAAEHAALPQGELPELVALGPPDGWAPAAQAIAAGKDVGPVDGGVLDAGGLAPDLHPENSWSRVVGEVDPIELLEVQLCNETAPFILLSRLRPALAASPARRTFVVNVSAMEGQFARGYKAAGHPHTNMAKAALNMLTRTAAGELLSDGILLTSVDTGWITDERPHPTKLRLAREGFHAPLDLEDGAARVYDPIVRGNGGEDVHGVLLKDYAPSPW